jgi:hypothetical protein
LAHKKQGQGAFADLFFANVVDAAKPGDGMSITLVPLSEADHASLCELLVRRWECDWSAELVESYYAWRYRARASGETLVAYDRARCIAILDSFVRPYWIAGRCELVRETCDWFCLPEYRVAGVGLHMLRRMMGKSEPILSIGGAEMTLDLLFRLKWVQLRGLDNFLLLISSRTAAGLIVRHLSRRHAGVVGIVPDVRLVRRLQRLPPPSVNAQVRARTLGEEPDTSGVGYYVFAPQLDTSLLDWLACAPALLGKFILLSFLCDGVSMGVSISRLQMLDCGCKAEIVHLHTVRPEVIDWMVSETVHHLIERGAGAILCRASCPITGAALSMLGFARRPPIPIYWWPANKQPPPGIWHLTSLRADDALQFG